MTEPSASTAAFQIEILPDDENPATLATLDTITVGVWKALEQAGYSVKPGYRGTRGGEWLTVAVEIVTFVGGIVGITGGIISGIKTLQDIFNKKGQEAPHITLYITHPDYPQLDPVIQNGQQLEISQLEKEVKRLEEEIKQLKEAGPRPALLPEKSSAPVQAKLELRARQPARKKRK